jgi:hypothetical protein
VEKVVDVIGLYHDPPEKAVVLCVNEKSASMPGPLAAGAADDARAPHHDYAKNGVTSLFAAFNMADGTGSTSCTAATRRWSSYGS